MRTTNILLGFLPKALTTYKYNKGDILISANLNRANLTRFDGDTLYSIPLKATIRISDCLRGNYSCKSPSSSFAHESYTGHKYYEVTCDEGFIDNFSGNKLHPSNKLIVKASTIEDPTQFLYYPHNRRKAS